jgi:hypothetical protein
MDLAEPLKTEVLRPLATLVVPGTIAVGPFVLVLGSYVPAVKDFWAQHPNASAVLLAMCVVAAGYLMDEISTSVEAHIFDKKLDVDKPGHKQVWNAYLQLQLNDELVGQRYLRLKVTQLKFELAMSPALLIFLLGLLWLQFLHVPWSWWGFMLVAVAIFCGSAYLLWEAWQTAGILSDTRTLILKAIEQGPKGIQRKPDA